MLALDPFIIIVPAAAVGLALLGYAAAIAHRRNAKQAKLKPVPISSRRRVETEDN